MKKESTKKENVLFVVTVVLAGASVVTNILTLLMNVC